MLLSASTILGAHVEDPCLGCSTTLSYCSRSQGLPPCREERASKSFWGVRFKDTYDAYPRPVMKADACRVLYMHYYGGEPWARCHFV